MCSTTHGTRSAGTATVDAIPPITTPRAPSRPLQPYLEKYYQAALAAKKLGDQPADDSVAKLHVPVAMLAHVATASGHHFAGVHADEMHFSASLVKVAAMFAAFTLRAEARKLAPGFTAATPFLTALAAQFSSSAADVRIRNAGASVGLKPQYLQILAVTEHAGSPVTVEFSDLFDSHMKAMIEVSDDSSAAHCIRRLGYAYINVALVNGGYFDGATTNGIWLCGDYGGGTRVEIPSVNDQDAAQVVTARAITKLFSDIMRNRAVDAAADPDAHLDMRRLLANANPAYVSKFGTRLFSIKGQKIGVANLKPNTPPKGEDVFSEGLRLKWKGDAAALATLGLTGDIAACWQNLRDSAFHDGVPAIAQMIEKAFSDFIHERPL
jgi:hypothetical protein